MTLDLTNEDNWNPEEKDLILGSYYLKDILGNGVSAGVFEALNLSLDEISPYFKVAIKILFPGSKTRRVWRREVAAHNTLSRLPTCNKYVVCLFDAGHYDFTLDGMDTIISRNATRLGLEPTLVEGEYHYLVTEYMDGDLICLMEEFLDEEWASLHSEIIVGISKMLIEGLRNIHSHGMAHMDIKPENLLYRLASGVSIEDFGERPKIEDITIKYGDLGFACTESDLRSTPPNPSQCTLKGTPYFIAPEIIEEQYIDPSYPVHLEDAQKADVWSLGLTLWELIYGESTLCQVNNIYTFTSDYDTFSKGYNKFRRSIKTFEPAPIMTQLFCSMIEKDNTRRPTAKDLLSYFN